jgi:hypothetical protein
MSSAPSPREKYLRTLQSIPSLKLPPSKLDASLLALVSARNELRSEVIRLVLRDVYPEFKGTDINLWTKRAFRALVAPALTRLHFARSESPLFRIAPNAELWKSLGAQARSSYVAICLFDFARVKIGLDESLLPPNGSLREIARKWGPRMVDRVRGLEAMLRFYYEFHPSNIDVEGIPKANVADVSRYVKHESELGDLLLPLLPRGKIVGIDETRYVIMHGLHSMGILASSFVVDEWLKMVIGKMRVTLFRSAYTKMDSLIINGLAFNAIAVRGGE